MHIPVLLNEILEFLNPQPGQNYIDATANGGGHAIALLERVQPNGKILAFEWDPVIADELKMKKQSLLMGESLLVVNDSYVHLTQQSQEYGFSKVCGVLFDLGMSSFHIDLSGRGFSFQKDEPLDMRFDPLNNPLTAAHVVNSYKEEDLQRILKDYGEERFARLIAKTIVELRRRERIFTTAQLVAVIKRAVPAWYQHRRIHCATKTFQALRIEVNGELDNILTGLGEAHMVLDKGGRIAVITFHSLEDRIVKNYFRDQAKGGYLKLITKKPIHASFEEIRVNPRARSAQLRVAEKII